MSFIDKIILRILILSGMRFFDCIDMETDDDNNVLSIKMYKGD